jgi:poly(ADP-ribose) glycohydrolase ARH3
MERGTVRSRFPGLADLVRSGPGHYGAATEMTAAVAASLAAFPGFNGVDLAHRMANGYHQSRGYGQATTLALERVRAGIAWREAGLGAGGRTSFGNGAAVRAAPVGLLYHDDVDMLRWVAEESAAITHQHALGAEGAALQAVAVATAAACRERPISPAGFLLTIGAETGVREFRSRYESAAQIAERTVTPERIIQKLGNGRSALGSVVTAAYCFARHSDSFEQAVALAAWLGGSAHALASMTGAIAGAYLGIAAIPAAWLAALESAELSRESFTELADALVAAGERRV